MTCPRVIKLTLDNKLSCEQKVTLTAGQSLFLGNSLPEIHLNRPREKSMFIDLTYCFKLTFLSGIC